jgi:hypothetical protein
MLSVAFFIVSLNVVMPGVVMPGVVLLVAVILGAMGPIHSHVERPLLLYAFWSKDILPTHYLANTAMAPSFGRLSIVSHVSLSTKCLSVKWISTKRRTTFQSGF